MRTHRERQNEEIFQTDDRWQDLDLIFPSSIGTPQDQFNVTYAFRAFLVRSRLPIIRFHDLRHTAASLMLNHGVPAIVVSRRLGHSKVSIMLDTDGYLMLEMQNDVAEKINEIMIPVSLP